MTCADTSDSVSGLTLTTGGRSTRLPRGFCHLIVDENGSFADSLNPTLDMLATPDLQGVVNAFTNRLDASPETFRARLHFRQWPEMRLAWHAVHGSAGVGELVYDGQHRAQTMLLLSGTDEAADVAAIRSLETTLGRSGGDYADTFARVRATPRPLLVTFAKRSATHTDASINLVEWSFAAAFFDRLGVL